jgi:ATP-binding cassette subfamily B (MDR/TAP) protein 1
MMEVLIDMQYGIGNKNINDANFIALIFFILGIASFIAVAIQQGLFTIVGANLTKKLRIDSYRKILKMSISWFDIPRNSAGNLIARLETDCQQVNGLTSTLVGMNAQVLSTLITGLIIAFYH